MPDDSPHLTGNTMDGVFLRTAMRPRLQPRLQHRRSMVIRGARLVLVLGMMLCLSTEAAAQMQPGFNAMNGPPGGLPPASRSPKPTIRRTVPFDVADTDSDNPLLQPLADVRVEGNATIPEYVILQKVQTREGRPASQAQITDDVRTLYETRWFTSVAPVYQPTDDGLALVFRVVEKPVVRSVEFIGNSWKVWGLPVGGIKDKRLEAETGLRPGAPFEVTINKEAAQRIRELFIEKGYRHVKVELRKGGDPQDRDVVFVITPGPKVQVRNVYIEGNTFARDAVLKLNKETKARWWFPLQFVGGKYDPESIPNDEIALTQYYQGLGFFDVEVEGKWRWADENKSLVDVVFDVKEGRRFRVRDIKIVGEQVVPEGKLRENLKLVRGEYFNARHLGADVSGMKANYDELGRLFATVDAQPTFLDDRPGYIDLVYNIDEDKVYYIGDIHVSIRGDHPHTSEDVVRNQVDAYIQPGALANAANIRKMQSRLLGSHLWERTDPPAVNIRKVEGSDYLAVDVVGRAQSSALPALPGPDRRPAASAGHSLTPSGVDSATSNRPHDLSEAPGGQVVSYKPIPFGHSVAAQSQEDLTEVFQKFLHGAPPRMRPRRPVVRPPVVESPARTETARTSRTQTNQTHEGNGGLSPADEPVMWEFSPPTQVIRGQSDEIFRGQSFGAPDPGSDYRGQSMDSQGIPAPQDYMQGVSPQGDPYGNALRGPILPGFVDVDIDVTEARTGRLMFGVGVNSDAGVVGNIVLEENNFEILRPPTSFADILNGQAWRGGGQSFRIEAVPGSEVSRYLMSWQDPFFMNTDFSLGVSGFYYNRFFEDWDEQRLGGRVSLGRLLGNFWSLSGALRLENVNMSDFRAGSPPALTDVAGDNFLSTGRIALAHDTRDSSYLPTQGHMVEGSYEQAFGDFDYPRFELTGSQFFTVYERPDGRGKHILQLRGQTGWTGDDTPIFEKFYAGGYQSFRGFEFRGVTPRESGVKVGGQFMAVGTVEYVVPITANDNVRGVVFSDFGTVEPDVTLDQFRVSVGAGLRLIVPAMGPAPIALDFAYPIVREDFDQKQIFSFYVGFTR